MSSSTGNTYHSALFQVYFSPILPVNNITNLPQFRFRFTSTSPSSQRDSNNEPRTYPSDSGQNTDRSRFPALWNCAVRNWYLWQQQQTAPTRPTAFCPWTPSEAPHNKVLRIVIKTSDAKFVCVKRAFRIFCKSVRMQFIQVMSTAPFDVLLHRLSGYNVL